jgi:hypothetical protein
MQHLTFTEIVVVMLLGMWLMLSISYAVLNHFTAKVIYKFNVFKWISAYQLFTETPKEYRIYYRDQLLSGETTDWHTISLIPDYKWWHFLWHPGSLVPLTIISTADNLMGRITAFPNHELNKNISDRFNYQVIQHYVFRQPVPKELKARQFKIEMEEKLPNNSNNVSQFVSNMHTP